MSVTIAPVRLLLVGFCLLLAWPLAAIATAFRSEEDQKQPMEGWRKWVECPVIWLGRAILFFTSFQTVKVSGIPETADKAPLVCAAPHSSFFDSLVFFYLSGLPSGVSKEENKKVPIIAALMEFTQPVYVKREDPDSRQNTIREIKRRAATGGKWPQIIIFPEGTCTNRSCLISFKPGAFLPGVPVQPVCLKYPNKLDTITWTWEGPGALTLLWLTLCQINTHIEIEFLPVYTPSQEEKDDPKLFANNVRAVMARYGSQLSLRMRKPTIGSDKVRHKSDCTITEEDLYAVNLYAVKHLSRLVRKPTMWFPNRSNTNHAVHAQKQARSLKLQIALKVPVTDHTYDDCRLMVAARKLNLPMEAGIVEFQKLRNKLGISLEKLSEMLEKFSHIDLSGKGHITLDEFSRYLQVPVSDSLKEVYDMYDRDGSGKIDFREFVIGLSLIATPANTDSTISLAFQIFDPENEGHITLESLTVILHNAFGMEEVDVEELFKQVDADHDGIISFDDFKSFAQEKPEYAPLFIAYQELKAADTNANMNGNRNSNAKTRLPVVIEEDNLGPSDNVQPAANHIKAE